MDEENFKKSYALIIGINRIAYEMFENYLAFHSIRYNNNIDVRYRLPTAMYMLMKNHYHIYVIEASKIIPPGQNHFLLNKALNLIEKESIFKNKAVLLKRKLNKINHYLLKFPKQETQSSPTLMKNLEAIKVKLTILN